jgi:hypothetical protein
MVGRRDPAQHKPLEAIECFGAEVFSEAKKGREPFALYV